ncbi:hypothetical protein GCM10009821_28470 [Aeromicrobium halocynthiae]|uniref:Uncharacterized protein n=1 Tax=Aeromicrobium halocynthiae TaxID=560557 RepID=A0ABN2W6T5_9ACTN
MAPTWKMLYASDGPFATVVADISLASASGIESLHALSQTIGQDLDELGAPPSVVDEVRARFAVAEPSTAPQSRFVVASPAGVLVDEVVPDACSTPLVEWEPLPDPGPLLDHETERTPVILVTADPDGGGEVRVVGVRDIAGSTRVATGGSGPQRRSPPSGGLSHETWQPRSAPVHHDEHRALAESVTALLGDGPRLVVVTGDPAARREVVTSLGEVEVPVAEMDRAGHEDAGAPAATPIVLDELVSGHVRERVARLEAALGDRLRDPGTVAVGASAALDAITAGRASAVILDRDATGRRLLDVDGPDDVELGSLVAGPVRADLALLAAASITNTAVALLDAGSMAGHGAVALLR